MLNNLFGPPPAPPACSLIGGGSLEAAGARIKTLGLKKALIVTDAVSAHPWLFSHPSLPGKLAACSGAVAATAA